MGNPLESPDLHASVRSLTVKFDVLLSYTLEA